jgi:hypothetical protein
MCYRGIAHWFSRAYWRTLWWEYGWSRLGNFEAIWSHWTGKIIPYCAHTSNKLYHDHAKIIAIVMDNAMNNDTMMVAIQRRCHEAKVYFSAVESRLRCMPHTVHLAAIKVCASCHTSLSESEVITSIAPRGDRCTIQGWQQESDIPKRQLPRQCCGTSRSQTWQRSCTTGRQWQWWEHDIWCSHCNPVCYS